jgi:hypothetical protein
VAEKAGPSASGQALNASSARDRHRPAETRLPARGICGVRGAPRLEPDRRSRARRNVIAAKLSVPIVFFRDRAFALCLHPASLTAEGRRLQGRRRRLNQHERHGHPAAGADHQFRSPSQFLAHAHRPPTARINFVLSKVRSRAKSSMYRIRHTRSCNSVQTVERTRPKLCCAPVTVR